MVSNYTAARHKRREDAYSEEGATGKRPNHAAVVYAQLARRAFPGLPLVLGGVEASLRRVAHYDYWSDGFKPSILLDAKADLLVFGMGERPILEVSDRLRAGEPIGAIRDVRGTAWIARKAEVPGLIANQIDGVALALEALNSNDHPLAYLKNLSTALQVASMVDSPSLGVVVDLYHTSVMGDAVLDAVRGRERWVRHVQLASGPDRHEPVEIGRAHV